MKTARHFLSLVILLFFFTTSPVFSQDVFEDAFEINPSQELDKESTEDMTSGRTSILGAEESAEETESDEFQINPEEIKLNDENPFRAEENKPAFEEVTNTNSEPEAIQSNSETTQVPINQGTELVEVRTNESIYYPYKQRQNQWGFSFSLGAENVSYPGLISQFDEESFEFLYGTSGVPMLSLELGPKYNMSWGSLALLAGYGLLDITDDRSGANDELTIQRYSATAIFYLDNIWSEPYFVPYVGGGIWMADYSEIRGAYPDEVSNTSTDLGYHYKVGALIGLDWIEPESVLKSRRETGMKAMFVNVYASSTFMSESEPDPDLENELDLGASLVFEF
jgi:hypothetical protein